MGLYEAQLPQHSVAVHDEVNDPTLISTDHFTAVLRAEVEIRKEEANSAENDNSNTNNNSGGSSEQAQSPSTFPSSFSCTSAGKKKDKKRRKREKELTENKQAIVAEARESWNAITRGRMRVIEIDMQLEAFEKIKDMPMRGGIGGI